MKPGRWQEIEQLYHLVQELKQDEREAVLQKECAEDESLRREVESLLVRPSEGHDFLETPALEVAAMALAKDRLNEPPIDLTGRTIAHYRVLEKIGEGGMGVVYKARDLHLRRFVALKVLPSEHVADPDRRRRFAQEARAASALNHPNIVTIHDITREGGTDFIVMEYVEGKTLDKRIGRRGLRLHEVLKYAVQIADALARAHGAGIIHRDLKPSNVMVDEHGLVKVLDFGLAKLTEATGPEAETAATRTGAGTILGTAAYMSPEQAEGKHIDTRSDIFSFGSMLYEMLTGQRAFRGDTRASTIASILREEPKPISQVAEGLPRDAEKIVRRCLRKDPEHRFQTMPDLRVALEELKEESDSGVLETGPAAKAIRHSKPIWALIIVATTAIAVVGVWLIRLPTKAPRVELTAVPLTSYPGIEAQPTFSPDGSQVAFVWDGEKQDNFDIYVKLVNSGGSIRLTTDPAIDYNPVWSPDGSSIAFLRDLPGGRTAVLLMPPIGGPERKLAQTSMAITEISPPSCLAWSPDGTSLAIVDRSSPNEPFGIFLLSVETGEKRKLTSPPHGSNDGSPAFSPDGRALVFARFRAIDAAGDLLVQQLSSDLAPLGEPKLILRDNHVYYNPAWTLDGREIIFAFGTGFAPSGLWRIAADGSGKRRRLDFVGDLSDYPSLSRQRNRLAYTRSVFDSNIWRIELPGSRGQSQAVKLIASTRNEYNPQFSADGRKIVFTSDRSGSSEIWVCNRDGSHAVQVTTMGGPATGTPRWSPDGEQIAFDSSPGGNWDIFVVGASGGRPRRLTNQPTSRAIPSWSRDGKWIYFCSQTGQPQIWKMPAQGGNAAQMTRKGGFVAFESPDGRSLYYTKSEEGTEGLWRMPVEGGEETQVLDRLVALRGFAVTNLGICFLTKSNVEFSIQFFSFATAKTERIGKVERPVLGSLTVSPDGKTVVYAQADQLDSDLMLVENFR